MAEHSSLDACREDAFDELDRDDLAEFLLVTRHGEDYTTEHYTPGGPAVPRTVDSYPMLLAAAIQHICSLADADPEDVITTLVYAQQHHFDESSVHSYPD